MICTRCQRRPCRLSGRAETCKLCDRGHTRKAHLSPAEKASAYQCGVVRGKGIKARTNPPGPMKWQRRVELGTQISAWRERRAA